MNLEVNISSAEIRRVQDAVIGAGRAGERAQRRAIREVGRKARSVAAREVAGTLGVPQKVIRSRVQVFTRRTKKTSLASGKLWGGLKRGIGYGQHRSVAQRLRSREPKGFEVARRGRGGGPGWFTRVGRERYPIREHYLDIDPGQMGSALKDGVETGFKKYPRRLRQLYDLELRRERNRRRGRRRRR